MELSAASQTLATLGHPGRLSVFRLLMRFAPQGVRPTEIAETLGLKPNTLSHHLSDLAHVGLIRAERQGRSLLYSVDLDATGTLVGYLVDDCCRGRPDICAPRSLSKEANMTTRTFNVLFICSGNSARSIFAEAILRDIGADKFRAFSAGTRPGSQLNPFALDVLARNGHAIDDLRSKHVSEFQNPNLQNLDLPRENLQFSDPPRMDFVFTVCDLAAAEDCAPWPGQPLSAHWGIPDPVKASGTDAEKGLAFAHAYGELRRRIMAFAALPFRELEKVALQQKLDQIGRE